MRHTASIPLVVAAVLIGCQSSTHVTKTATIDPTSASSPTARHEAETVNDYIARVQGAKTPIDEAEALRQLRKYETDHGLTYTVRRFRAIDNTEVPGGSLASQPVRAQVTIFRGREALQTFNFVPKDNRNLAVLGE